MTSAWCTTEEAAEHFGISLDKLAEAVADSIRACIAIPRVDHGKGRAWIRWCVADLDSWMKEVGAWRLSESSRAASGKSGGATPTANRGRGPSRRSKRATASTPTSHGAKTPAKSTTPTRERIALLRSTTA